MAVTAIVRFTLPEGTTREEVTAAFEKSAPLYRDVQGLTRKYYLVSEDGRTGGGVYLFESRADAERLYDDAWRAGLRERLGVEPRVEYFDSPVIVDNEAGSISTASGKDSPPAS